MELMERFALGDLDAFETLFRQFQSEVYGWIVRIVRDPNAAEDLTIETFWRIHRAHARFDPKRCFRAWARRVATNIAVDHLKSARRERLMAAGNSLEPAVISGPDAAVYPALELAFRQLPARLQTAAVLALVEEQSYKEIGDALGISTAAVKSRVFRAIRLLRKKLRRAGVVP